MSYTLFTIWLILILRKCDNLIFLIYYLHWLITEFINIQVPTHHLPGSTFQIQLFLFTLINHFYLHRLLGNIIINCEDIDLWLHYFFSFILLSLIPILLFLVFPLSSLFLYFLRMIDVIDVGDRMKFRHNLFVLYLIFGQLSKDLFHDLFIFGGGLLIFENPTLLFFLTHL